MMKRPGLAAQGVIGLVSGLLCGAAIAGSHSSAVTAIGNGVELGGKMWINAILMTIVPLVFAKIFVAVAGGEDSRGVGRKGFHAVAIFALLLVVTAVAAALLMPAIFDRMPVDGRTSAALRAGTRPIETEPAAPTEWVLAIVPANAIRAAADGAMVPLLVFAIAFAFAATRIADGQRKALLQLFQGVDAAISELLRWIVRLSPYGIFALAVGLAMHVGAGVVSALGYYVVISSCVVVIFTLLLYPAVALMTPISTRRFAAAAMPPQIVAFSTHSSAASLPAMIESAERLGLPRSSTGFVLPLSLAIFKFSGPVWFVTVACFVARLYGVPIAPSRMIPMIIVSVVTSFAIGGVPSGAAVLIAPVLQAAGLPVEAMALLLAVDPLPNAFRTVSNVTGMLAVTALCGKREQERREVESTERPPMLEPNTISD